MGVDSIGGDRGGNVAYLYGLVDRNGGITSVASGFSWSVLGRTGRPPGIHARGRQQFVLVFTQKVSEIHVWKFNIEGRNCRCVFCMRFKVCWIMIRIYCRETHNTSDQPI